MTPASAESSRADAPEAIGHDLLPEVLKRLGKLEVRAAKVVDGFLNGRHHSPFLGRSLEFREHREYAPGDDLRHVDWKALARQDKLLVKQYEEETNLRATLLVDSSGSMGYRGDRDALSKHEYAATAACALAHLLTMQHDAVACRAFGERVVAQTPHRTGRQQVAVIADAITGAGSPGGTKTDLTELFREAGESIPRRGIVVLLSDLLCPVEPLSEGLALLAIKKVDTLVLQVMSDDELDFPLEGATRFVSLEGDAQLDANPRALRAGYLRALADHQAAVQRACARGGAEHRLIRTSQPLDAALVALLAARQRRARNR